MNNKNLLEIITDNIDEGIICISKDQKLNLINKKAKEILGIVFNKDQSHPAGHIMPDDIVIIVDNALGEDDGGLESKQLKYINVDDKDIKPGDMFIGVGVYQNPGIKPVYKYFRKNQAGTRFTLNTEYLGFDIIAYIDLSHKKLSISINGIEYSLSYINSIGHMVIIDGMTGYVKFYQANGFTVRKEDIVSILEGSKYLAKDKNLVDITVIGRKFSDIVEYNNLAEEIENILNKKSVNVHDQYYEINKRPIICSISALEHTGEIDGVMLKMRDVAEIEAMLSERNKIIESVEKMHTARTSLIYDIPEGVFVNFIGSSSEMNEVKYLAFKASKIKSNIIITGESGTGKSKLAEEIHNLYSKNTPFIEVNCSSIPHNLFESELFGYTPGAFTGALSSGKVGYFEMANGGTIFLDEIGEIPTDVQVKLLHVLQNKRFYKVGSSKPINIDVRVIAATNKDLEEEVEKGTFRQDLFYRINVFPIKIPPLRERKTDIYLLLNKTISKICKNYNLDIKRLSSEALAIMLNYDWPGNVRELENIIERAIAICDTAMIYPEHININVSNSFKTLKEAVHETEKRIITQAFKQFGGDKALIMENLDISKSALYEKLKKYDIEFRYKLGISD